MLRIGSDFSKISKDYLRRNGFFFVYIRVVKLLFGEEPLHTPRKHRFWEISHIDVFGKMSKSKVKGTKIDEQFINFLRGKLRV